MPFQRLGIADLDDTGGNGEEVGKLCGAVTPRLCKDFGTVAGRANGDGLDEAVMRMLSSSSYSLLHRGDGGWRWISEFRRMHTEAITAAGAALIRFAQSSGLVRGEWITMDGFTFLTVASIDTVRERTAVQRYLDSMDKTDADQETKIDQSAVQAALKKLKHDAQPEAAYTIQTAGRDIKSSSD